MKYILVILVCGHFDCHWDRAGVYDSLKECYEAAGYHAIQVPKRYPTFKCEIMTAPAPR